MVAPVTLDQLPIPTESIAKISHHANDHGYEHGHKPTFKKDGHINPIIYAISHSWKAAAWGAVGLLGFTGLLKGSLLVAEQIIPAAMAASAAGTVIAAAVGIGIAGALYYGATAFMKAYNVAQEHNYNLVNHLDGKYQDHMREQHPHQARPKEMPARSLPGILPQTVGLPAHEKPHGADPVHQEKAGTARHIKKILEDGPRSLSPKELAQRIHEQRSATQEAGL